MFCKKCGAPLAETETVCPKCGTKLNNDELNVIQQGIREVEYESRVNNQGNYSNGLPVNDTVIMEQTNYHAFTQDFQTRVIAQNQQSAQPQLTKAQQPVVKTQPQPIPQAPPVQPKPQQQQQPKQAPPQKQEPPKPQPKPAQPPAQKPVQATATKPKPSTPSKPVVVQPTSKAPLITTIIVAAVILIGIIGATIYYSSDSYKLSKATDYIDAENFNAAESVLAEVGDTNEKKALLGYAKIEKAHKALIDNVDFDDFPVSTESMGYYNDLIAEINGFDEHLVSSLPDEYMKKYGNYLQTAENLSDTSASMESLRSNFNGIQYVFCYPCIYNHNYDYTLTLFDDLADVSGKAVENFEDFSIEMFGAEKTQNPYMNQYSNKVYELCTNAKAMISYEESFKGIILSKDSGKDEKDERKCLGYEVTDSSIDASKCYAPTYNYNLNYSQTITNWLDPIKDPTLPSDSNNRTTDIEKNTEKIIDLYKISYIAYNW